MSNDHRIDVEQNRTGRLALLRAQRVFYGKAKILQTIFVGLALLLPTLGAAFGADYPKIKPYLALAAIVVLLLEVIIFSRSQRDYTRLGAKAQEQFDVEVLNLPWSRLVAGAKVDPEEIREASIDALSNKTEQTFRDWYEPMISALPLPVGRILCQRTNITYDSRIRRVYATSVLWFAIALVIALALYGLHEGLHFSDLILTVLVPVTPIFSFAVREYRKHQDTIEALVTLKSEVDKLWTKALDHPRSPELVIDSRAIQDAIYRNRAGNPLVYDWVYSWLRKRNEDVASHGAKALVEEATARLGKGEIV